MEYDHFFRPVGLALDVAAVFQVRVAADDNGIREAPQVPVTIDSTEAINPRDTLENTEPVIRRVWGFGYIPLPVVNYSLLWRRYGPTDMRLAITRTRETISSVMSFLFRAFIYVTSVFFWLRFILIGISSCGNMVTFSQSFFSDIFTFSLRNYPSLLERRGQLAELAETLRDIDAFPIASPAQLVYDAAALKIHATCAVVKDGSYMCELTRTSLIFKLCDILEKCYPVWDYLPSFFLTATTICIYITYALGAQVLNINVVTLVSFVAWKRQFPLVKCVFEMVKGVLTGAATSVL